MKIERGQLWQVARFQGMCSSDNRGKKAPGGWWHKRSLRVKVMAYFDGFVVYRSKGDGPRLASRNLFLRTYVPWKNDNAPWTDNRWERSYSMTGMQLKKLEAMAARQLRRIDSGKATNG